jgi:hypothetical protein
MLNPKTYPLSDTTFVDVYGFFAYRKEDEFELKVPEYFTHGKLCKYKNKVVKLRRIEKYHYGDIAEIEHIEQRSTPTQDISKRIKLSEFVKTAAPFQSILNYNSKKIHEGYKLFDYLRNYNPIYFTKDKDWKKPFRESSKVGDYFILNAVDHNFKSRLLNKHSYLIIATYNKGYKNGFMAIELEQ